MEEMVLSIRRAEEDDVEDIIAMMKIFAQEMGHAPYKTKASFLIEKAIRESRGVEIFVAASEEMVAGYIITTPAYSSVHGSIGLYVEDLYVRKEMRALGIGLVLIREIAKIAAEQGGRFLRWDVDIENSHAIDFYQKIGAAPEMENRLMQLSGEAFDHFIQTQ